MSARAEVPASGPAIWNGPGPLPSLRLDAGVGGAAALMGAACSVPLLLSLPQGPSSPVASTCSARCRREPLDLLGPDRLLARTFSLALFRHLRDPLWAPPSLSLGEGDRGQRGPAGSGHAGILQRCLAEARKTREKQWGGPRHQRPPMAVPGVLRTS